MKEAVLFIINSVVGDETTQVILEETPSGIIIHLKPTKQNIGKIIGKKGKIVNALRKIFKIRGLKENKNIFLKVEEI